jgi:catechol 2,3-dioxygenase-like lactoylglutathione lyase family enzyme
MRHLRLIAPWLLSFLLATIGVFAQSAKISSVEAIGFTVSDMDRSVGYYSRVLHFEKLSDIEYSGDSLDRLKGISGSRIRVVRMRLRQEEIELTQYLSPGSERTQGEFHSNDLSFQHIAIVVSDMNRAYAWLRENNVRHVSSSPQTLPAWNREAAGIQAFYFQDPDGHVLEIIHFPEGKGNPRWQQSNDDLFQGIDHTAIVVSNTEKSINFYTSALGMRVVGVSENYGYEQEHLNNVFGAHLKITSLRSMNGPGVELLEYLAPTTGRPIPSDEKANDLTHWETVVDAENLEAAWPSLTSIGVKIVSAGIQQVRGAAGDERQTFQFRDPDGHVIEAINDPDKTQSRRQGR